MFFHPDRPPFTFQVDIGKVVEKADMKAYWGNYLSGAKLRRDSGKINQENLETKNPADKRGFL